MPRYTIPQRLARLREKSAKEHALGVTAAQREVRFLVLLRRERDDLEAKIAYDQETLAAITALIISYEK